MELIQIKRIFSRKGQNLAELALIIGVLGLVLIGMGVYVKRGLQGKVKDLTDKIIGKDQAAYQQDTSGLAVNRSKSSLSSGSTVTLKEFKGGGRSLKGDEISTYKYESTIESK